MGQLSLKGCKLATQVRLTEIIGDNYELTPVRVANFSSDVKDAENYAVLLAQIAPEHCDRGALKTRDLLQRAEQVLQNADVIGCRKFLTPSSLVAGNPKLNLAFVANLFNTHGQP